VNHPAGEERPGAARADAARRAGRPHSERVAGGRAPSSSGTAAAAIGREYALIMLAPEGPGDLDSSSRGSEGCHSGGHVAGMTESSSPADPFETVAEEGGK